MRDNRVKEAPKGHPAFDIHPLGEVRKEGSDEREFYNCKQSQ